MSLSSLIAPEVLAALAAAAGPAALIWAPTGRIKRVLAEIEASAELEAGAELEARAAAPLSCNGTGAPALTAEAPLRDAA